MAETAAVRRQEVPGALRSAKPKPPRRGRRSGGLTSDIQEIDDAITMRTTPARRGELLAELGPPGRTHEPAAKEWDFDPVESLWPDASTGPTPLLLDWPSRRGPVLIFAHATNDWLQEARTPSQILTGTPRGPRNSCRSRERLNSFRTPSSALRTQGDPVALMRRRTARRGFWGAKWRAGSVSDRSSPPRRPLTRPGPSGPDPVRLFGAAWAFATAEVAPGDDRCPNHPGAPRSW